MSITYDYYRIFYYVAKYHSFTRAAKILMNSQPNITRAMNNLEQELGCRLFQRSHRGVALTPEGEKLFAHVQVAQEHLQAGETEIANAKNLKSGNISIGASEIALHGVLLPVLRQFHLTYPEIHIQVTNHSTPQAVSALKMGMVEVAVVVSPTGVAKPLREDPVMSVQDILIAGPNFSDLRDKVWSFRDISAKPMISLGRNTKTYEFYDGLFAKHGVVLQPDIEVATTDQILPMVRNDLGLGFLPEFFAKEAIERGEVFQIYLKEAIPERSICLVQDSSRPMSAAVRVLQKMIYEFCNKQER